MSEPVKPSGSVLCFGELLLRMCPDAGGDWLKANKLPFYIGGAELNVASALALWNIPSKYFTVLPGNDLSAQIVDAVKSRGIDTSPVHYGGHRVGLYYLTQGEDLKHNALVYDRADSAFANLRTGTIDWDNILEGVKWFHLSAICPAISQNVTEVCLEVLKAAVKKNIVISVDLNYRSKLWQYGKPPLDIMRELVNYCDLIMGNIWAAETMLGIPVVADIHQTGSESIYLRQALETSEAVMEQFPKCKVMANTFRFDAANAVKYYTTLYTGKQAYHSKQYETSQVIDRVGSGDCFMAGLIYGFYNELAVQETLEFATAAAFGKLSIMGDATTQTAVDVNRTIK